MPQEPLLGSRIANRSRKFSIRRRAQVMVFATSFTGSLKAIFSETNDREKKHVRDRRVQPSRVLPNSVSPRNLSEKDVAGSGRRPGAAASQRNGSGNGSRAGVRSKCRSTPHVRDLQQPWGSAR